MTVSVEKDGGVTDPDTAESTSNCRALEVPPLGAGVCTVIDVVPAAKVLAAGTWAVSCVLLPNWVGRAVVPQ